MNKKFFIAAGAVVLGVAGFLATSAHSKFANLKTAWFKAGSTFPTLFKGAISSELTSTVTAGKTAFFKTALAAHTIVSNSTGTAKAYYK